MSKRRVQDINVWLQCFALYVSVMANKSPQHIPELMAYMVSILRASQQYEGLAWTMYDAAYLRQATATGHKEWSKVNPSLYTGCHLTVNEDPDLIVRMRPVESAVVAFSSGPKQSAEICHLFNEKWCRFRSCKYCHICLRCSGNHPAI